MEDTVRLRRIAEEREEWQGTVEVVKQQGRPQQPLVHPALKPMPLTCSRQELLLNYFKQLPQQEAQDQDVQGRGGGELRVIWEVKHQGGEEAEGGQAAVEPRDR